MKRSLLMAATAFSTAMLLPVAASSYASDKRSIESYVYKDQKLAVMNRLFDAQVAIENGYIEDAADIVGSAVSHLRSVLRNGAVGEKLRDTDIIKLIELKYGGVLFPKVAYRPVEETQQDMRHLPDMIDKIGIETGDVEDVEVKYVRIKIADDDIMDNLDMSLQELSQDNAESARAQLMIAQRKMIYDYNTEPSPQEIARDHIMLTRAMIRAQEYEGARESLEVAEMALLEMTLDYAIMEAQDDDGAVNNIRRKVLDLQAVIERRDASLLDQIDIALRELWQSVAE